jgi:hypothetical protein
VTDQSDLFPRTPLDEAVTALRKDLLSEGGPKISTIRNYRFAILPYKPSEEFKLRQLVRRLGDELRAGGWNVLYISLQNLLMERLRALGPEVLASYVSREKRIFERTADGPFRALEDLRGTVAQLVEGPQGLAADVVRMIVQFADANPDERDQTVVFVGRAGALYPFFRTSALLKNIDQKTRNIPVILLYPGERRDTTALSFMGELDPDRDYRPRIYP